MSDCRKTRGPISALAQAEAVIASVLQLHSGCTPDTCTTIALLEETE